MTSKITIIGAGLVGSLWAVLLRKRGFEVDIFEKRSDIRKQAAHEDRSINLVITSRGLNGLHQAGLLEDATKLSVPIFGRMIHPKAGELMYQPYGQDNECNFSISRTELNKFLISSAEKAGAKLHFDHALANVDFKQKALTFENGQVFNYDLLFGTDGAGSRVRKALCEHFPLEFFENTEWLDADYKELHMPVQKNGEPQIKKNALHIWPRGSHMMMALANLDNSFTMTVYMPRSEKAVNFAAVKSASDAENLFKQEFSDAIPLMPTHALDFVNNPQGRLGTVRCSKWVYQDSVCLLGDAAHAIVPFFGQGMNAGFEDCTNFLQILDQNKNNWAKSLYAFEAVQKPNANAIADMAIENWQEMRDKVGDAKFLLRKKVESLLEKEFPAMFKSRYGMVTYTRIPYSIAFQAGQIQDQILGKLCEKIEKPEQLDLKNAEQLLRSDLSPFVALNNLNLKTDDLVSKTRKQFS